jgi:Zn-dependent peptidase ImmA (M78 family)
VLTPREIPDLPPDVIEALLDKDPYGWSAVSLSTNAGGLLIYNPRNSKARRSSDVMHELAHFLLDHRPTTIVVSQEVDAAMRSFDAKQENEANWLAGAILLPRDALMACLRKRMTVQTIAEAYGTSEKLVTFRKQITGVDYQLKARRRA